jgi:hypothetical protein
MDSAAQAKIARGAPSACGRAAASLPGSVSGANAGGETSVLVASAETDASPAARQLETTTSQVHPQQRQRPCTLALNSETRKRPLRMPSPKRLLKTKACWVQRTSACGFPCGSPHRFAPRLLLRREFHAKRLTLALRPQKWQRAVFPAQKRRRKHPVLESTAGFGCRD